MKTHYKAHARPLSRPPEMAQTPLELKLNTVVDAVEILNIAHQQSPWKTFVWPDENDNDNNNNNNIG